MKLWQWWDGQDIRMHQSHVQRTHKMTDTWAKQRSGREDGQLGDRKKVGMEEHQNDQEVLGAPSTKAVVAGLWTKECGLRGVSFALQLNHCFAMLAEIKGCELLLRMMNDLWKNGTQDNDNVEKAVKADDCC